eukprot:TRINITY_DN15949_c0_g1_i2.p1 TRINITY_DN15949_c0_g1~~TRINITY_DN15949_c0_g1_i2.p1  ORF type:complete len:233 (+),score=43.42 TRINITY_DN15949_c0_g1_i2:68-700(+)
MRNFIAAPGGDSEDEFSSELISELPEHSSIHIPTFTKRGHEFLAEKSRLAKNIHKQLNGSKAAGSEMRSKVIFEGLMEEANDVKQSARLGGKLKKKPQLWKHLQQLSNEELKMICKNSEVAECYYFGTLIVGTIDSEAIKEYEKNRQEHINNVIAKSKQNMRKHKLLAEFAQSVCRDIDKYEKHCAVHKKLITNKKQLQVIGYNKIRFSQ